MEEERRRSSLENKRRRGCCRWQGGSMTSASLLESPARPKPSSAPSLPPSLFFLLSPTPWDSLITSNALSALHLNDLQAPPADVSLSLRRCRRRPTQEGRSTPPPTDGLVLPHPPSRICSEEGTRGSQQRSRIQTTRKSWTSQRGTSC